MKGYFSDTILDFRLGISLEYVGFFVLMILISRLPLLLASAKHASSVTADDQSLRSVTGSNSSSSGDFVGFLQPCFWRLLACKWRSHIDPRTYALSNLLRDASRTLKNLWLTPRCAIIKSRKKCLKPIPHMAKNLLLYPLSSLLRSPVKSYVLMAGRV